MDEKINLVSIQPIMHNQDILEQWSYYESFITKYLEKNRHIESETFITLPEYALGNKSTYDQELLEKTKDLISKFVEEHNVSIVAGSHAQKEGELWYNRAWLFDSESQKIQTYDKKHLFNFELKNDITPGSTKGIFTVGKLKVKILICSDLWFPEEIRSAMEEKIDLIIVPAMAVVQSNQYVDYGKTLWHSLAQTRSKENIIPLMVSDWAEQSVRQAYTCGSSCIIDPSQRWTNDSEKRNYFTFMSHENEGFITKEISMNSVREYRKYRMEVGLLPNNI